MSFERARRFVYRIDASDTITYADNAWVRFALNNGGETLTEAAVVGRSLWDYVSGDEVRHLYEHLFERVRRGFEITIPFRCDSPMLRRFHEMHMVPRPDGEIEVRCRLLREEARTPRPLTLLEPGSPRGEELIVMCSWCKKVEAPGVDWLELDEAATAMDLFGRSPLPSISHSICPPCKENLSAELARR